MLPIHQQVISGTGNPQYGNHTLNVGKVYTEERHKKVSEAVKRWAKTHREHYYKMGVLGEFLHIDKNGNYYYVKPPSIERRYELEQLTEKIN